MSRRSSRLVSGGYYNSDEESDSSTVTTISYRENPVKVFKKKAGTRKAGSRTSSRANSNASSPSNESPVTPGPGPSPLTIQLQPTMRTVPYVATTATPRPALTPSSPLSPSSPSCPSSTRGQTPTRCPSVPPEKNSCPGLCSSSRLGGLHLRPNHKELNQSSIDSSGYSSSEGTYRKPAAPISTPSKISSNSVAPSNGYKSRISSAFFNLMGSISLMAAAAQSKIMRLAALANNASFRRLVKRACGLFLLLLLILLCIWFLLPLLTSFISRMTVAKSASQTKPKSQPATPVTAPPPPPRSDTVPPKPLVDSAFVFAAVEAKTQRILEEMQLKQGHLLSQMKEGIESDMQGMKAKLEAVESDSRLRLEEEVAGRERQMAAYQTDSQSAISGLILKIEALEAQNAKLSQELSSIQLLPPPAPCPDTSTAPVLNHLTPELQQAIEKWLTDYITEQDIIRLGERGGCSDCGRPIADKMADFALETQGASVISTRCSETYRIRSACVTLFGFPLWYPSESPRTVIQGYPVLLPGKCWAFHGVEGTLVISLSHPIRITHVTLDHLPRYNSPTGRIDSAPKDFEVYGMRDDVEEGTLLGTFTYDKDGESTQTFKLPNPSDEVHRFVELRVLTNWGHVEYTCVYRFRVHGVIAST